MERHLFRFQIVKPWNVKTNGTEMLLAELRARKVIDAYMRAKTTSLCGSKDK